MTTSSFLAAVERIFSEMSWPYDVSPAKFVREWDDFVNLCKRSYPSGNYEYYNEIRVREWIEAILAHPELAVFEEHHQFREVVAEIDNEFRALLQANLAVPGKRFWWESGVLRFAGSELVLDFKRDYGISIEAKDR